MSSKDPKVIANSIRDLEHHAQVLNLMNLGPDSVMIIHGGGVYGDKCSALERLKTNIRNLEPSIKQRLVLENCEMCYTVEDLLPICQEL